jgi:hypothetical protein
MNTRESLSVVLMLVATPAGLAQGTFQNLNFESANLTAIPPGQSGGEVSLSAALPGWNASIGGTPVTQVLQNNLTLGNASIDILGPDWNSVNPGIIDGNYSVFLQSGGTPQGSGGVNTSLWQDGTIAANAASLQFKAWGDLPSTALFSVSFGGNNLVPITLSSGESPSGQVYTLYGINVSAYAGQTGQLEFTSDFNGAGPSWLLLDDISFSTQVVPEPRPLVLTGLGALLFALNRRFAPTRLRRLQTEERPFFRAAGDPFVRK